MQYIQYFNRVWSLLVKGRRARIGANSILLYGATIEISFVVAAGAFITRNVVDFTMVDGVPAKVIKYLLEYDIKVDNKIVIYG